MNGDTARGAPFDGVAAGYDREFTTTPLGRALRQLVWHRLERRRIAGMSVLELGCGTGEDARWLAEKGAHVLATDQSTEMLALARQKCAGLPVRFARLDIRADDGWAALDEKFDLVFSNFGALNAIEDWDKFGIRLAGVLKAGGTAALVIMGRYSLWEMAWFALCGDWRRAFRRLGEGGVEARIGGVPMRVFYPTTAQLKKSLGKAALRMRAVHPIGVLLPPTYLDPMARRRGFPLWFLQRVELAIPLPRGGDHTFYELVNGD